MANVTYTGTAGDDVLVSANTGPVSTGNDTLLGNGGDDVLIGGIGNDVLNDTLSSSSEMFGGVGNDTYMVTNVNDTINENFGEGTDTVITTVNFTLFDYVENITAKGTAAISLTGNDDDNVLDGSQDTAANVLTGGLGNDTYIVGTGDTIVENANEGTDTVQAAISINLGSYANIENATVTGTAALTLTGTTGTNVLTGNSGANILDDGSTTLTVGSADTLVGGAGNDTYYVHNAGDVINEASGGGTDLVNFYDVTDGDTYTLSANVENLTLQGTANINGTGSTVSNVITGNAGDNVLDGGGGTAVDTFIGGAGNDTYHIYVAADKITESTLASGGTADTVIADLASGTYTLAAGLENLTLGTGVGNGGTAVINGTGNTAANVITGNAAANILNDGGGAGVDTMTGGDGNDTYIVNNAADVINELISGGTDQVNFIGTTAGSTYTLGTNLENLTLGGTAAINGTGNTAANLITGNSGNNVLDDGGILIGGGTDSLVGGAGNDTYVVNNSNDFIFDASGTDTVKFVSSVDGQSYSLATGLENITLSGGFHSAATGNLGNNIMTGDAGDNTFDGGGGTDVMRGGAGNDTYTVDSTTDIVVELNGAGTDSVIFNGTGLTGSTNYTLSAYVENLTLGGSNAINGYGNAQNNIIEGNSGNNILNGGGGTDTVSYANAASGVTVDLHLTTAQITGGAGTDTLSNFENMLGSTHADTLTGSSGNNTIDGGGGNDTLIGGGGTDTVSFASSAAGVTVSLSAGTATGNGTVTLSGFTHIIGSTHDDTLGGDIGNNTIDGGGGNDTVSYASAALGVVVDLSLGTATGDGTDTLVNITNAIGSVNDDVLKAASTGSVLDGGGSADVNGDTLQGGAGNDTLIVHTVHDIADGGSGGFDILESSLISLDLTNSALYTGGIENATLLGAGTLNITGDGLANVLTGNTGDNSITGGAGNDTLDGGGSVSGDHLIGGAGTNTYIVYAAGDHADDTGGTNSVLESGTISLVLTDTTHYTNLENATLLGSTVLNLTGDGNVNILTGNSADNTIDGGAGADTMIGGGGNDTFVVDSLSDRVSDTGGGNDLVQATVNIDLTNGNFSGVENVTITSGAHNITGDAADNVLTGSTGNNLIDGGGSVNGDTLIGGGGTDTYTVYSANDHVTDNGSGLLESSLISLDLTNSNYTSVENATLMGSTALNITGDANANVLTGNTGDNTITGGGGNDTFDGFGGNDTLIGGLGADHFVISATPSVSNEATITDFHTAQGDVLDLSNILTNYVDEGTDPLANFVSLTDDGSGNTIVKVDVNGTGVAGNYVQVATVAGGIAEGLTGDPHLIDGSILVS